MPSDRDAFVPPLCVCVSSVCCPASLSYLTKNICCCVATIELIDERDREFIFSYRNISNLIIRLSLLCSFLFCVCSFQVKMCNLRAVQSNGGADNLVAKINSFGFIEFFCVVVMNHHAPVCDSWPL